MKNLWRGEVWWVDLPDPEGSEPGGTRPVLVLQANSFNRSAIATIVVAVISSNERLAFAPGNVLITPRESGLKAASVVNVSQILTVNKASLRSRSGRLSEAKLKLVELGVKLVLGFEAG